MSKPLPLTEWQSTTLPESLPRHIRRNIAAGPGDCWLWTRSKSDDGYGWASLNNKTYQAHVLLYKLLRGVTPSGLLLDHLCRIRHCVNPNHLEPVTYLENLLRSPLTPAGRMTCVKGHAFVHNGHQRRCPVCLAEYNEATREARIAYLRQWRQRKLASVQCS
jgi:hypothetical protein